MNGEERDRAINGNDWKEYRRLVLSELERLNAHGERIDKALATISTDITMLKVKAGLWGLLGGLVPVTVMLAVTVLR